jgi:hypothetical protein
MSTRTTTTAAPDRVAAYASMLDRVLPAIRVIETGKVLIGDRTMTHHRVAEAHAVAGCHGGEFGAGTVYDRGFVDPLNGHWYEVGAIPADREVAP